MIITVNTECVMSIKATSFFRKMQKKSPRGSALAASTGYVEHVSSPREPWVPETHHLQLEALHVLHRFNPHRHPDFKREKRCVNNTSPHCPLNGDVVSCEFDHLSFHGKHSLTTAGSNTDIFSVELYIPIATISCITKQKPPFGGSAFTVLKTAYVVVWRRV